MIKELLNSISNGCSITIHVNRESDTVARIMLVPKITVGSEETKLSPIIVTGAPDEIEAELMDVIQKPLQLLSSTANSILEFEKSTKALEEAKTKKKEETTKKQEKKAEAKEAEKTIDFGATKEDEDDENDTDDQEEVADEKPVEAAPVKKTEGAEAISSFLGNAASVKEENGTTVAEGNTAKLGVDPAKIATEKPEKERIVNNDTDGDGWFK